MIDKTGVGQGVFDRLKELDYPVRGVSFGEESEDSQFANLKAEWHWREREWLLSGGRLLYDTGWNEFEVVKYKTKDGRTIIQPKEELFRDGIASPNCVDAAVLTMVISDVAIKNTRTVRHMQGREFGDATSRIWRNE